MIIAIASDNGVNVSPLTDDARAFVLFEVGESEAVRTGYRSRVMDPPQSVSPRASWVDAVGSHVRGANLAETLSDCAAVIACEIDVNLRGVLEGKAIDALVSGEESVDLAAQQYASRVLNSVEDGAGLSGRGPSAP